MATPAPFPKPNVLHCLVAAAVILLGIWGTGVMLSWLVGPTDVLQVAGGFGILAPLLLIVQQYRATFRSHSVATQYCWIFFVIVATLLAIVLLFLLGLGLPGTEAGVFGLLLLASLGAAIVNYDWHKRLLDAAAIGLVAPHHGRASLREIMLWTVAAAVVCATAGYYVRLGSPFEYL